MSNPTGKGSEAQRWKPGVSGNPGGRTPTAWLRELLGAAHDKSTDGKSRREAIALHLVEVATSYDVVVHGRGEDAIPMASAKDAIAAATLLYAYDMGKPIESLEVEQKGGPRVLFYLPAKDGTTATAAVEAALPPDSCEPKDG